MVYDLNINKMCKNKTKRAYIRIYTLSAIEFICEHKSQDLKVNHHTDGKKLSDAPNTTTK